MADLDPELYRMVRERQRARKEHTIRDIAATFKLGRRSDYGASFRRLQEKQAMEGAAAGQLSQLETYYFGREFEARQNAMNQAIQSSRAAMNAELGKLGVMSTAAQARARNVMGALNRNMDDTQNRMDMLQEMSPMGQNLVKSLASRGLVRPGSRRGMTQMAAEGQARQHVQALKAEWSKVMDPHSTLTDAQKTQTMQELQGHLTTYGGGAVLGSATWEEDYIKNAAPVLLSEDHAALNQEAGSVSPDAPPLMDPRSPEVARLLGNVLQNQTSDGQKGADVLGILNAIGVPSEHAVYAISQMEGGGMLARQLDQAIQANAKEKWITEEEQAKNAAELEAVARRTFPDSKPLAAALSTMASTTERYTQERGSRGMDTPPGQPGSLEQGAPEGAPPGAPGAPGAPDERTQNFYDILGDTSGSAPDRFIRMLGAVTDFEDLPPAAALKAQVMGSDKMKDYMSSRGLRDPEVAFRLMNREVRVVHRNNRKHDRRAIKKLREKGVILSRDADIERPPKEPAAALSRQAIVDRAMVRAKESLAGQGRDTAQGSTPDE